MSEPLPGGAEVKGHVLIVEDEAVVGIFLRIVLADAGIHASVYQLAQPALEAARVVVFSAAIVDIGLPDMPGDELARQLRVLHPRLPIILATGYDMNTFAPLLRDHLVRVLEKPYDTSTTIITFLMVFLIQNTQNRDSAAIQVKLDELIRSIEGAHVALLDLEELEDKDLNRICAEYRALARQARRDLRAGKTDTDVREVGPSYRQTTRPAHGDKPGKH